MKHGYESPASLPLTEEEQTRLGVSLPWQMICDFLANAATLPFRIAARCEQMVRELSRKIKDKIRSFRARIDTQTLLTRSHESGFDVATVADMMHREWRVLGMDRPAELVRLVEALPDIQMIERELGRRLRMLDNVAGSTKRCFYIAGSRRIGPMPSLEIYDRQIDRGGKYALRYGAVTRSDNSSRT